jgi:hypothetical protein
MALVSTFPLWYRQHFSSLADQLRELPRYSFPAWCYRIRIYTRRSLDVVDLVHQSRNSKASNDILFWQSAWSSFSQVDRIRNFAHARRRWQTRMVLAVCDYGRVHHRLRHPSWPTPSRLDIKPSKLVPTKCQDLQRTRTTHLAQSNHHRRPAKGQDGKSHWSKRVPTDCEFGESYDVIAHTSFLIGGFGSTYSSLSATMGPSVVSIPMGRPSSTASDTQLYRQTRWRQSGCSCRYRFPSGSVGFQIVCKCI